MALLAQDLSGGALGSRLNYTLCMDVAKSSYSITCIKGTPCPPGQDVAKAVYAGDGETYNVDWSGACTKVACPHPRCDPPDGMPFSFLLLDDDSRGVAKRVSHSRPPQLRCSLLPLPLSEERIARRWGAQCWTASRWSTTSTCAGPA